MCLCVLQCEAVVVLWVPVVENSWSSHDAAIVARGHRQLQTDRQTDTMLDTNEKKYDS